MKIIHISSKLSLCIAYSSAEFKISDKIFGCVLIFKETPLKIDFIEEMRTT